MHDKETNDIFEQARSVIEEISVDKAHKLLSAGEKVTFLDIREPEHVALGYIKGCVFIRGDELEMQINHLLPDKNNPLLLYCAAGDRSLMTALALKEMGYTNVSSLKGGIEAWRAAGYELVTDGILSREQIDLYSRQIILQEIGIEGQKKLLNAKVLMIGAGGLGSSAGLYLASSGVGTIGIVDFDRVDKSNLSRQVLHDYDDIGRPKVESAMDSIKRKNPDINVITYKQRFSPDNALDILKNFDIVLDASDNFPTKYLINDAAFFTGIPYVFGAAVRFEGHASVYHPKSGGPCMRCLHPVPPGDGLVPT